MVSVIIMYQSTDIFTITDYPLVEVLANGVSERQQNEDPDFLPLS